MAPRQKKSSSGAGPGKLRIIGGRWRGRVVPVADLNGLRPTGNRIRETLFNWLQADIPGAHCLDLFAGSGALGLEALSRGARHITMVELNADACDQLHRNLISLEAHALADVRNDNTLQLLQRGCREPYDLVFLDPPFDGAMWQPCIDLLAQNNWLRPDARLYIETPLHCPLALPQSWRQLRLKRAGSVQFGLYSNSPP